jgi:hypothetical protein
MLAKPDGGGLRSGPEWAYEPKLDGYRAAMRSAPDGTTVLTSRNGIDFTAEFASLAGVVGASLDGGAAVLDGEIVVYNDAEQVDFGHHLHQPVVLQERPLGMVKNMADDGGLHRRRPPCEQADELGVSVEQHERRGAGRLADQHQVLRRLVGGVAQSRLDPETGFGIADRLEPSQPCEARYSPVSASSGHSPRMSTGSH